MLARLGRLYNGAVVAVERNNHGHAVLEALLHSFHYENIYAHETEAAGFGAGISTAVARATGSRMGWPTNAQTKPQAVMALDRMLRDAPEAIASRRLLEQCRSFVRLDGGASGAVAGARDDLVMAAAIAYAVREQSRPAQLLGAPLASRAPGA